MVPHKHLILMFEKYFNQLTIEDVLYHPLSQKDLLDKFD